MNENFDIEFKILNKDTVNIYVKYLKLALLEEPEFMCIETVDETEIKTRIDNDLFNSSKSILAIKNGKVLGRIEFHFYSCIQDGHKMAYINWVYVLKKYRNKGIGHLLFEEFEKECKKNNVDEYYLIRAENKFANAFYKSFDNVKFSTEPLLRKKLK
ncbi:MAG: GNAT family N-acetyltransferase [Oceanivirga sp.]|nr:GNAT family N-acetyltransferase [Oceanivirga sp.]